MFHTTVKITVVKVHVFSDLAEQFGREPSPEGGKTISPCPFFQEGDVFTFRIQDGIQGGEFCEFAKATLFPNLLAVASKGGATPPDQRSQIPPEFCCCNDGLRPVVFRLEALE